MRKMVLVLVVLFGCEPEPGETRCSSFLVGGVYVTKCKTAPPAPPPQQTQVVEQRNQGPMVSSITVGPKPRYPAIEDGPPQSISGDGWRCAWGQRANLETTAECFETDVGCAHFVETSTSRGYRMDECSLRLSAACVRQRAKLDSQVTKACFPLLSDCHKWVRDLQTYSPEDFEVENCRPVTMSGLMRP